MINFDQLPPEELLKVVLMIAIDEAIRKNYPTIQAVVEEVGINHEQLTRLKHPERHRDRYSIPWLLRVSNKVVGCHVKIDATATQVRALQTA